MQDKLGRRVVVFGRTIVVVWLLSVAAWLQKQDSRDLRDDVHDLKLMAQLEDIEPASELQELPDAAFNHTLEWIARHQPQIDAARVEVRTRVVEWLERQGVTPAQIGMFSGKMSAPTIGATPFRFIRVQDLSLPQTDDAPSWLSPESDGASAGSWAADGSESSDSRFAVTVAQLLEELGRLTAPRQIACATAIDERALASTQFSDPTPQMGDWLDAPADGFSDEPHAPPGPSADLGPSSGALPPPESPDAPVFGGPAPGIAPEGPPEIPGPHEFSDVPRTASLDPLRVGTFTGQRRVHRGEGRFQDRLLFRSASLEGNQIEVHFERMPDPGEMVQQMDQDAFADRSRSASIPVETELIDAPSLLELSDPQRPINRPLLALGADPERVAYLRRAYGHMPLDDATGLASDGLTQAYRSLTLFGFRVSTRRFPMAVLVCLAAALWQTLAALIALRRQKAGVLAEIIDDATIEVLVSNRLARFVLWVLLPLTALWTSLPLVPLSEGEVQTLAFGTVVLAVMGAGCVGTAERRSSPVLSESAPGPDHHEPPTSRFASQTGTRRERQLS
jgi:hypothetical protein